jgi:HTH-type transcriptional regulator/antitoxin HigA
MNIRPIHTEADYKATLREISAYFDSEPELGSEDGDRFEILLTLVEAYEAKQFSVDLPSPIVAIKFRMDQEGLAAKDLEPAIETRAPPSVSLVVQLAISPKLTSEWAA